MGLEIKIDRNELMKRKVMVGTPMYGGQCAGMYTRSIADLAVLFNQWGVGLQLYFLFNESLITRARNYVADEFMRSDCTHLMFIDSDIGFDPRDVMAMLAMAGDDTEYDVLCGPYPKKSLAYDTRVLTEDGYRKLGDLVREKYNGTVLSQSPTGQLEFKRVVNHFESRDPNKAWVKVGFRAGSGRFRTEIDATVDHEFRTVDVLNPGDFEYVEASRLAGRHVVTRTRKNLNPIYSKDGVSFLVGTMLGDATISKAGSLGITHCKEQRDYLATKAMIFGAGPLLEKKGGQFSATFPRNAQTKKLRSLMYDKGRKTVRNIIELIDEKSLAFWYMDDGCIKNNDERGHTPYIQLSTDGFSKEDVTLLMGVLRTRFGIESSTNKKDYGETGYRIFVSQDDADRFFSLVAPYIVPSMEYKLPDAYRGGDKFDYVDTRLSYGAVEIETVADSGVGKGQYDITVEDNHNFVASDLVVSNCISWEKIKRAVDKGVADKDPTVLDRFVGDFVFNPLQGETVYLDRPSQVLEAGTGFMMIRRSAFEKLNAARPDLLYKPDHVRTAAFDGSREIMAYFMDPIDKWNREKLFRETLERIVRDEEGDYDHLVKMAREALDHQEPESRRLLSEDYFFCQELRKAGGKVWLCPWMHLSHVGSMVFGGSLADLASVGAAATADVNELRNKK